MQICIIDQLLCWLLKELLIALQCRRCFIDIYYTLLHDQTDLTSIPFNFCGLFYSFMDSNSVCLLAIKLLMFLSAHFVGFVKRRATFASKFIQPRCYASYFIGDLALICIVQCSKITLIVWSFSSFSKVLIRITIASLLLDGEQWCSEKSFISTKNV